MRILIVKLSSLGDVVHTTPVVSDILHAYPDAKIDWVIEEGFAGLLTQVQGLDRIIPIAWRRWRKKLGEAKTRTEMKQFYASLQSVAYDWVIDAQGLIKSAVVAKMARRNPKGLIAGLGLQTDGSSYEPLARWFYQKSILVPKHIHVVDRARLLFSKTLNYSIENKPLNFGLIPKTSLPIEIQSSLQKPYIVFVHATSRADKQWPEKNWIGLGQMLIAKGFQIVLPWGSPQERQEGLAIANALGEKAYLPPRLSLPHISQLLFQAAGIVGVDTGLIHIATALHRPTIQLYNFPTAWRTGATSDATWAINLEENQGAPSVESTWITLMKVLSIDD